MVEYTDACAASFVGARDCSRRVDSVHAEREPDHGNSARFLSTQLAPAISAVKEFWPFSEGVAKNRFMRDEGTTEGIVSVTWVVRRLTDGSLEATYSTSTSGKSLSNCQHEGFPK